MAKKRSDGRYEKTVTIDGKKIHFYGRTKREIDEKLMAYQKKEEDGVLFGDLADEWYEQFVEEHPSSERAVRSHYNRLKRFLGGMYAKKITPKMMTTFFYTLDGLSNKTVTQCKWVASQIFTLGIYAHDLTDDPTAYARTLKIKPSKKREPPTPEEVEAIKRATDAPYALFYLMALYTGLRRGELLRLTYGDVDRTRNTITVSKSVYHQNNRPMIKEPKTAAGKRTVILLDPLKELIPEGKPNEYIFGGSRPWSRHETQRHLYAYQRRTGIKCSPHQLRHAYRTILYEAGIDERMRMELLGHRNISTTRDIYTHISNQKREATERKLNEYFRSSDSRQG